MDAPLSQLVAAVKAEAEAYSRWSDTIVAAGNALTEFDSTNPDHVNRAVSTQNAHKDSSAAWCAAKQAVAGIARGAACPEAARLHELLEANHAAEGNYYDALEEELLPAVRQRNAPYDHAAACRQRAAMTGPHVQANAELDAYTADLRNM